ncbi:hypothetical protein Sste5346_004525 [Sporothrix stenoceras]|uniref:CID domain-containing protein n=1 Tax=Sporothrix stenoceras TaxID=5173 RepID=A0ABR3Z742_9PEZI
MSSNNNNTGGGGSGSGFNVRFPAKHSTKKSIFERQRAEAEAKRQREAAETAAVYEDFVKSFDDDGGSSSTTAPSQQQNRPFSTSIPQPKGGSTVGATGGRRHFSIPSSNHGGHRNSGPGSLGGGNNSNNNNNNSRSRDARPSRLSDVRTRLAFGDDEDDEEYGNKTKGGDSEEEGQIVEDNAPRNSSSGAVDRAEEKATSKPTIRLANMPPGTSPAAVKALVLGSSRLTVDAVRILPSTTTNSTATDRKSVAAIVTLAADTAASDIDAAVSAMQNRYLGYGYYLNLHRHLSSAVVAASSTAMTAGGGGSSAASQPFGARPVPPESKKDKAPAPGFAPPAFSQGGGRGGFQGHGRGMAMGIPPPATFNSPASVGIPSREGILHVPVRAPRDIKKLRMVHKVIEQVLDQGPEFEALLMSRPEVQFEEKWAWLWDARCEAGVWYRYRLWETVTGLHAQRDKTQGQAKRGKYIPLFEGSHAWKTPDNPLPYEFDTSLVELVSDSDYNSSDDSDAEAEANANANTSAGDDDKESFLNPLEKARLTHLLARLPTTLSKLRKGDVARVTAFAITHASRGANEIVDLIVANVKRPLAYTKANPEYEEKQADEKIKGSDDVVDTSGAQLIAVYVVSDILSSSATSGIRHAWRFRQLFDAALRRCNVFASLGRLADKFQWGRMRAEKWKRSIGLVLGHWEGWSVFSAETQAFLVSSFENPPRLEGEKSTEPTDEPLATETATSTKKSRWKTVDTTAPATDQEPSASGFRRADSSADDKMQVDSSEPVGRKEGVNDEDEWAYRSDYTDDEALDLACMDDEDIDGEPMEGETTSDRRARLDGFPLTDDEIRALVGDMDDNEMSEEGEIASDDGNEDMEDDDDNYEAYGMSDLSSSSEDDRDVIGDIENNEVRGVDQNAFSGQGGHPGHGRDVAMHDAQRPPQRTATSVTTTSEEQEQEQPAQAAAATDAPADIPADPTSRSTSRPTGTPSGDSAPSGSSAVQASVQASQASVGVQASSVQTPQPVRMHFKSTTSTTPTSSSAFPPRKRMRAVDMFDDSGDEGSK